MSWSRGEKSARSRCDIRVVAPDRDGDVLVARVGRNLQNKVAVVVHGTCVVSDCVFILRAKPDCQSRLLEFFTSDFGRSSLTSTAHGVGARYVSTSDVLDLSVKS